MPRFIAIGYGDRAGYDRTPRQVRDAAHETDARLVAGGAIVGTAGPPHHLRNPDAAGVELREGAYMAAALPVAGFAVIEAADLDDAVAKLSGVPCAVAHGVVEIWPLVEPSA